MKHRKLRIAWSVVWGIAAVLLAVLWIRSYWSFDEFFVTSETRSTRVDSNFGKIQFATEAEGRWGEGTVVKNWGVWSGDALPNAILPPMPQFSALGFTISTTGNEGPGFAIGAPSWFLSLIFSVVALTPWIRQLSWRFSLRTLLIATTLIAIGLGLIVAEPIEQLLVQ